MPNSVVRVGYDPDFPPFSFRDGNAAAGLAVDIVRSVLARAGYTAMFVAVAHASQDAALAAGEVDALAFMGATAARGGRFDFSDTLFTSGGAWFYPVDEPAPFDRPPPGARVATPAKGPLGAEIETLFADIVVVEVETYPEAFRGVLDGRANLAALNLQVGTALAQREFTAKFHLPLAPFKPIAMACAFAKGANVGLLADFDRALLDLKRLGEVAAIEGRWHGG